MDDSELDWDADFDFDDPHESTTPTVVLSGVAANPDEEEVWDDDFDLEESHSGQSKKGSCAYLNMSFYCPPEEFLISRLYHVILISILIQTC